MGIEVEVVVVGVVEVAMGVEVVAVGPAVPVVSLEPVMWELTY